MNAKKNTLDLLGCKMETSVFVAMSMVGTVPAPNAVQDAQVHLMKYVVDLLKVAFITQLSMFLDLPGT